MAKRSFRLDKVYGLLEPEPVVLLSTRTQKEPRTLHHQGRGVFMVAGKTIKLPWKMKAGMPQARYCRMAN